MRSVIEGLLVFALFIASIILFGSWIEERLGG